MSHDKQHLAKPTILTKTRYIGFARTPVSDDSAVLISGLPAPKGDYELRDGGRWIDLRSKERS